MLSYLKRCRRSVADQRGIEVEHLIVDGQSSDGTDEWLSRQDYVRYVSERDGGMYDALNKGLLMASADIVGYLNCDEQYLPGALSEVKEIFSKYRDVDVIFGDAVLVRPDGSLIAYRKGYQPRWYYIAASHLYVLSCTMFFRRKVIEDGVKFDTDLRAIGDQDFVVRLLRQGYRARHVPKYLAAFTMTGSNMSVGANADKERMNALKSVPMWVRMLRVPINLTRLVEKTLSGGYHQSMPFSYSVYDSEDSERRTDFTVTKASFRWKYP